MRRGNPCRGNRPTWTDKVGAERLAGGVYAAHVAAVQKALAIEAAARADHPAPARPDTEWPDLPMPDEVDFDTWLAAVSAPVAEVNARLDRLPAPEPLPDAEFRSPNG